MASPWAVVGVDHRLTSQHLWEQMDQIPVSVLPRVERAIVAAALTRFSIPLDTLLFDATNFFTFIASTNARIPMAARGKQKQKRNDLRQMGVAVLCSRTGNIPLWHCTYGGNLADAKSCAAAIPLIQQRLRELGASPDSLTIIYDKGMSPRRTRHWSTTADCTMFSALTVSSQAKLVEYANSRLEPVLVGEEPVRAFRTRQLIWGRQRTVVVLVSERLREGHA